MQQHVATDGASTASAPSISFSDLAPLPAQDPRYAQYKVIRRNGSVVAFEPAKISLAMTKAYITGVY
jgi:ribonucleoside-diphosphate reductase alpha chain